MSSPRLIIVGAGGHARSCIDVIERQGVFKIAGLIGLPKEFGSKHLGYQVIGADSDLPNLVNEFQFAFIALGQIHTSRPREKMFNYIKELGYELPSIISPDAYVSRHANIGSGSIVMNDALVNAGANIGENCIINSRALIEHDTTVGNHCHISTSAILNGGVSIGEGSFIGSGCAVKQIISIGKNCTIGMGLVIRHHVNDDICYTGSN
jgi:sugar O-acyltransferase (sialic acid O-acetyltransferase NeuD family)